MVRPTPLPRAGAVYVITVVVIGFGVLLLSIVQLGWIALQGKPSLQHWYLLAALTLLSSAATVRLAAVPASISVSEAFVFASVLLYSPAAGVVIVALDGLLISILPKRRRELHRVAFNMAAPALSLWIAGQVYYSFPGIKPFLAPGPRIEPQQMLGPLAVFALVHFLLNSWLIAAAVAFEARLSALFLWRSEFLWLSLNYFAAASVSAIVVITAINIETAYISISISIPLLLTLYYTFKIPMDRVKDTKRHLDEVNALYESTIQTLAMAVDAKDQVTHGHIRRVHTYTLGLARALSVSDPGLLEAIDAAALLHDMGKLAIPEHILNKPGKLSPAEFAKMQQHASLGADILSEIAFRHPVIPIVRHHHENWDGTGYPSGLAGTQIPIGARILAVVDCYDALTSDRPYRPRLPDVEASSILLKRRGNMYDPLVVDTFLRIHRDLAPRDATFGSQSQAYADIGRLNAPEPRLHVDDGITRLADAVSELLSASLTDRLQVSPLEHAASILSILVRTVNADAGFIAVYDSDQDVLVITASEGLGPASLVGFRIALGECLTGWVAANRQPMINSDAALDLSVLAPTAANALRFGLSVSMESEHHGLSGVLSFFSASPFTPDQLNAARALSPAVARLVCDGSDHPAQFLANLSVPGWSPAQRSGLLRLPFEG